MKRRGFTLLELMLVLTIMVTAATMMLVLATQMQQRTDMFVGKFVVGHVLRMAQERAKGVEQDAGWGVYVQDGQVTMFRGPSYVLRDPDDDEIYELPGGISVGGNQEFIFTKFTGDPTVLSSVTLTSSLGEVTNISLNPLGTVLYSSS